MYAGDVLRLAMSKTAKSPWCAVTVLAFSWFCVSAACFADVIALAESRPEVNLTPAPNFRTLTAVRQSVSQEWQLSPHVRGLIGSGFYAGCHN